MSLCASKTGRVFRLVGVGLFGALAACCLTSAACPHVADQVAEGRARAQPAPDARPEYDVAARSLDLIPPGTVIDKAAPKGWSHLIIKSQPRAGAGDVKKLTAGGAQTAGLLSTEIVANVEKAGGPARFRLTAIAIGLGVKVNGQDTIVSPDKQVELGANLKFIERIVLNKATEKLKDVQVVVRSDTLVLIDASNLLRRDGRHQPVVLRYAVLVDPATGRLDTLLWVIDRDERGGYRGVAGPAEWLPPNKMEDCVLHVDGKEVSVLGVPSESAFAIERVPQGQKQVALPEDVKPIAGRMRLTGDMARQLEMRLREVVKK